MKKRPPLLWEELTMEGFERLRKTMDMVILPVGSTEQHGPHLPLNTDTLNCYEVAKRLSMETGVVVAPPIQYGCSQGHAGFPGTISLRPETLMKVVAEVCGWFYQWGFKKVLILNGHFWNASSLGCALENLRYDYPDIQVKTINWWEHGPEEYILGDSPNMFADSLGPHANVGETSCVLALRPELVEMKRAVDEPEKKVFFYYRTEQVSRSGVGGRPTLATREKGEEILRRTVEKLKPLIERALSERVPYPGKSTKTTPQSGRRAKGARLKDQAEH